MTDPFADLLPPADFSNVVGGGPSARRFERSDPFADLMPSTPRAAAPLMQGLDDEPQAMPERTGMEAVSDAATRIRQGLNSVVGGAVAAPVNIANMMMNPPHQRALNKAMGIPTEDIAQPDFVRGIQESLSVGNELEGQGLSDKAKMQAEQFQNTDGFVDATKYLIDNPSYALTEGAAQIPQFLQLVPGSVVGTVGAQAAGAASQSVQQIEEELRKRGVPESEIKDRAADAFAQSMVINSALPMIPGGTSFDRLLAGKAEQVAGAGATRFLKPLIGETVTEGAQESTDQVIQNYAQDDPLGQGVGQAAALGTLMGTTTGGIAGGVDLARGDANAGMRQATNLTGQLERDANRIRTPESDAVDAGRETARAIFAEADAAARPDPATIDPERKPEKIVPTRLAELEAKPEPTLFEREEMALLQEGKPFDRQALLADLESAPEPELIRNGTRVFYPGDVKAMRAKLAEAGLSEGMRMTGEDGADVGLYFPARLRAEVDAVLRPKPAEQAQPEPVKEGELPYRELGIPPPRKPRNRVKSAADFDPNYHDIRDFIALHGGLDAKAFAAEFNSEVPSPAENFRFFGKPLFRKSGGLQPDQLRELLQETGFLNPDSMGGVARYTPQDAYELVDLALDGNPVYHPDGVDTQNAIQNYNNEYADLSRRQEYIDEHGATPELDEEFARRADAMDRGDLEPVFSKRAKDRTATPDMFGATQRAQTTPTPRPASGDLFGAPTPRDRLDAAQRDSDARLTGPAVGMRQGDGELFAGRRPEQADIEAGDDYDTTPTDELRQTARLNGIKNTATMGRPRLLSELRGQDQARATRKQSGERAIAEWQDSVADLKGKQPWEMTQGEWTRARALVDRAVKGAKGLDMSGLDEAKRAFKDFFGYNQAPNGNARHEVAVLDALQDGKPVPERVRAEYRGNESDAFRYEPKHAQSMRDLLADAQELTDADFTDDAQRRKDAARDGRTGTGRTDMAAGDGELFAGTRPEQKVLRSQRPDTQGIEVDEATPTPEELAAFNRQVDTGRGQRETPPNDLRTSPSNADARRDGARRTVEDQGGRGRQSVPVQDGTFAPDAPADVSGKPPKFPRWFRQSKLKNPKGIPLEFNHTTNADFDTFDSSRRGSNTGYAPSGLGNWFSQAVEGYGSKKLTGNIRMENPKVMPLHKLPDLDTQEDFAAYADKLRDQGFDGIYFPDVKQAVTFDSVQFKENDNTEYSESPNIYKSKRNDDAKIFDDSGDYSSTEDMVEGVRNGDLLVHFRVKDGTDFQYGIDPSAGEFLRSTEAWQESESEHGEGPELTFFAENFNWGRSDFLSKVRKSDGNIEAVFVRKNDTLQKSLGNGRVLGGDGKESSYEMSRMADYESPLFRGEPAGVETGDWYTEKSQDVVGVASAESVKAAINATNPSILKSEGKKSAPKRLSDAEVKQAKADAESRVASHWGRSAVNKLKNRGRVEFITKQEVVDRGLQTMAELDGVDGFFDPESGKAYVIADSGAQSADLPGVLSHEVFHANAEQFLGTDGFKRLKEAFRKLKNRDKDIEAAYKRVPSDTSAAHVDEEGLAYLAQEAPKHRLSERLTDEAKLFLNRIGIPLDWLNAHAAAVRKIAALNLKDAGNRGRVARFTKDGVKYQKVFHGTPHRGIEKEGFKLQKIGTGEGAQAYGYGMYFAGNKEIAEHYRKVLAEENMSAETLGFSFDGVEYDKMTAEGHALNLLKNGGKRKAVQTAKEMLADAKAGEPYTKERGKGVDHYQRLYDFVDSFDASKAQQIKHIRDKGQLYHAEIPEDSDLLDWDKPLSEQPEKVRAALLRSVGDLAVDGESFWERDLQALDAFAGGNKKVFTGADLYADIIDALGSRDSRAASEYLNTIGIPGLRYRDGGSRGQGQMSYQDGLPAGFKYEKDQSGVGIKNEKGLWLTTGHRSEADAHRNLFGPRPSHNYVIWDETLLTPEKAQITPYYSKRDKPKPKVTGARPEELIEVRKQISSFRTLIKCLGG